MAINDPHDHVFRGVYADPVVAAALLRDLLPPRVVARLDLDRLSPRDGELVDRLLRERRIDLLFSAPLRGGGEVVLVLILEHQSTPDRFMPLRLLGSAVRVWEAELRGTDSPRELSPILPVVVFQGPGRWPRARRLSALFAGPRALLAPLLGWMPELRMFVEELATRADDQLPGEARGRMTLLLMKHARDPDIAQRVPAWSDQLTAAVEEGGLDTAIMLLNYLYEVSPQPLQSEAIDAFRAAVGPDQEDSIMGYAQTLREEGRQRGRLEGRLEGRREVLVELLSQRFGVLDEAQRARIEAADLQELAALQRRLLTADSLDELFS